MVTMTPGFVVIPVLDAASSSVVTIVQVVVMFVPVRAVFTPCMFTQVIPMTRMALM